MERMWAGISAFSSAGSSQNLPMTRGVAQQGEIR